MQQSRIFSSEVNEQLEVCWEDGRKVLNTKGTNYSYGGLQEVLNRGLGRIPLDHIQSVLVLGMGGGSVVDSLRNTFNYKGPILGIEIDPVVIKIAKKEFGILEDENVQILQADAEVFIAITQDKFDLVIVDIYIDTEVPEVFYSTEFWNNLDSNVSDHGFIIFNAGIDLHDDDLEDFLNRIPPSFVYQIKLRVLISNTVLILQKIF